MREKCYRQEVVNKALSFLGVTEGSAEHKQIIALYNSCTPHPRGHIMTASEPWCAAFVSAVAIACKTTDIIPVECSCAKLIEKAKEMGIWKEADNYTPKPADIILYDWQDSGKGDNKGAPDHVGIVEKVAGDTIVIIEGNYANAVKRRTLKVDGRFIRGYIVPAYDTTPLISVKEWQLAAIADGFSFPKYGADGEWGDECAGVARKAIIKRRLFYRYKNLTRLVQKALGITVDGKCGKETKAAIIAFQEKHGLTPDGEVGLNTWREILDIPEETKEGE